MLSFLLPHFKEEQRGSERLTQIPDLQPTSGGSGFKSCSTPESTVSSPQRSTSWLTQPLQWLFWAQSVLGAWPYYKTLDLGGFYVFFFFFVK